MFQEFHCFDTSKITNIKFPMHLLHLLFCIVFRSCAHYNFRNRGSHIRVACIHIRICFSERPRKPSLETDLLLDDFEPWSFFWENSNPAFLKSSFLPMELSHCWKNYPMFHAILFVLFWSTKVLNDLYAGFFSSELENGWMFFAIIWFKNISFF